MCTFMHCYVPNFEDVEGTNWFGPVFFLDLDSL